MQPSSNGGWFWSYFPSDRHPFDHRRPDKGTRGSHGEGVVKLDNEELRTSLLMSTLQAIFYLCLFNLANQSLISLFRT